MSIDLEQFKHIFFEESFEGLDAMESGLLELSEGGTDLDTINTIFRAAHSIKGGSATFGFTVVAAFTHVMEELLDDMRGGKREADEGVVNILLESVDVLRDLMTSHQNGEEPDAEKATDLQKQLEIARDGKNAATPSSPSEETSEKDGDDIEPIGWKIRFQPHTNLLQTGNDPTLLLRELSELGEATIEVDESNLPSFSEMNPEECYLAWDIELNGAVSKDDIEEIFEWVEDECDLELTPVMPERRKEKSPDRRAGAEKTESTDRRQEDRREGARRTKEGGGVKSAAPAATIRVGIDRLDEIIDMVGELVITQSMLGQLGEDFEMDRLERLRDGLAELERHTRQLQEGVMSIRMQPISFAFNRFPRMVHDLSQKLNKKIRLDLHGEETEMDKTVMEKINDPLVHLVRNSMDHGLETPEERLEAGKDEEGVVKLSAFHQGGSIVVEISDDGRGLDRNKIFNIAVERGVVKESDVLTDEQVFLLLFEAGFSTAAAVSDLSGRGVGLDVVRRNIESLGGRVDVRSTLGEGSTFTIRLPLTLAVLDGQLLKVDAQTFVMPLASIIESLQMSKDQIGGVGSDAEVYRLRDSYIPIIRLGQIFGSRQDRSQLDNSLLVVVELGDKHVGLLVDELLGQQQVVIKSLESNYERVRGISGATILGDGTVSLILDIAGLIEMSNVSRDKKVIQLINGNNQQAA
ncbi:MAG: chemotaxis protein CheA [Mariprofundaceae bacterium]